MTYDYDLFVIGGGSGGVRASRMAALAGARVALAEEWRMGGTCVIRGCIPKKLLVYASQFSENVQDAAGYGWDFGQARFDWPTLIANKDREIARLEGLYTANVQKAGVTIFQDRAVFEDPHTLLLLNSGKRITADKILIATGNRPTREMGTSHVIPGGDLCITSDEAFHLDKLPERILIAGGGYIAIEFAHIFQGLGSHVSLVYRGDKPLKGFDEDMRDAMCAPWPNAASKCCWAANSPGSRSAATPCMPKPTRAARSTATRFCSPSAACPTPWRCMSKRRASNWVQRAKSR